LLVGTLKEAGRGIDNPVQDAKISIEKVIKRIGNILISHIFDYGEKLFGTGHLRGWVTLRAFRP